MRNIVSVLAVVALSSPCFATNLDSLAGTWSGTGSMKPKDAPREKVKCKVNYIIKKPGRALSLDLLCASDAYKMTLQANIDQDGDVISGNWFESQYRQAGKITGKNKDDVIEARIDGDTVAALVKIRTRGDHQEFWMDAPGSWVSQVTIDLAKGQR